MIPGTRLLLLLGALVLGMPAPRVALSQDATPNRAQRDSLRRALEVVAAEFPGVARIAASDFGSGARTIAAGETVVGNVGVHLANLNVYGTLEGDAVVVDGDVIVHPGGTVGGNAVAVRGRVRQNGGEIHGAMYTMAGSLAAAAPASAPVSSGAATRHALGLAAGTFAILFVIGIGVLMFAGSNLEGVLESLSGRLPRAFLAGLAGQLAIAPVLMLLIAGLILTVLGILLIPFAIVAYAIAVAGMLTLGFLAVARLAGEGWANRFGKGGVSPRAATLRALAIGVSIFGFIWLIAAAFTWSPVAGGVLRAVAFIITWISVTAGFGAVILSRAGTRRAEPAPAELPAPSEMGWLTPTPVTGVAAARRPARAGERR